MCRSAADAPSSRQPAHTGQWRHHHRPGGHDGRYGQCPRRGFARRIDTNALSVRRRTGVQATPPWRRARAHGDTRHLRRRIRSARAGGTRRAPPIELGKLLEQPPFGLARHDRYQIGDRLPGRRQSRGSGSHRVAHVGGHVAAGGHERLCDEERIPTSHARTGSRRIPHIRPRAL